MAKASKKHYYPVMVECVITGIANVEAESQEEAEMKAGNGLVALHQPDVQLVSMRWQLGSRAKRKKGIAYDVYHVAENGEEVYIKTDYSLVGFINYCKKQWGPSTDLIEDSPKEWRIVTNRKGSAVTVGRVKLIGEKQ